MSLINIIPFDGYQIVELEGDFVGGDEINELREKLKELAKDSINKVVINLKGVSYLNSTALGVFLSANALFERNKGKIALCNLSDYLENIFKITKLNYIFTLYKNVDEAVASLNK